MKARRSANFPTEFEARRKRKLGHYLQLFCGFALLLVAMLNFTSPDDETNHMNHYSLLKPHPLISQNMTTKREGLRPLMNPLLDNVSFNILNGRLPPLEKVLEAMKTGRCRAGQFALDFAILGHPKCGFKRE